jgi:predicted O-methyltransferase YrrM
MEHYYQNIGEDWFTYPNFYSSVVASFPPGSKFVEVGSWRGRSACFLGVEIHNSGKDIKLDCVDTWNGSEEHVGYDILENDGLYKEFISNIEPISNIINPIRMESLKAVDLYEDESLDMVFLDASHRYEDIKNDMIAWYPKVKKGGIFSGHDYPSWTQVVRAVEEFFPDKNFISSELCWIHRK